MQATQSNKQSVSWRLVVTAICLVAAILVPLAVISVFWYYVGFTYQASTAHPSRSATPIYVVALACGGFFICKLPIRWPFRLLSLIIYIPVAIVGLFFYTLYFWAVVLHFAIT